MKRTTREHENTNNTNSPRRGSPSSPKKQQTTSPQVQSPFTPSKQDAIAQELNFFAALGKWFVKNITLLDMVKHDDFAQIASSYSPDGHMICHLLLYINQHIDGEAQPLEANLFAGILAQYHSENPLILESLGKHSLSRLNAIHQHWQDYIPSLQRELADWLTQEDSVLDCVDNALYPTFKIENSLSLTDGLFCLEQLSDINIYTTGLAKRNALLDSIQTILGQDITRTMVNEMKAIPEKWNDFVDSETKMHEALSNIEQLAEQEPQTFSPSPSFTPFHFYQPPQDPQPNLDNDGFKMPLPPSMVNMGKNN